MRTFFFCLICVLCIICAARAEDNSPEYGSFFDEIERDQIQIITYVDKMVEEKNWFEASIKHFDCLKKFPEKYMHISDGIYKQVKHVLKDKVATWDVEGQKIYREYVSKNLQKIFKDIKTGATTMDEFKKMEHLFWNSDEEKEMQLFLAAMYLERADYREAARRFNRINKLNGNMESVKSILGEALSLYLLRQDLDVAKGLFEKIKDLEPKDDSLKMSFDLLVKVSDDAGPFGGWKMQKDEIPKETAGKFGDDLKYVWDFKYHKWVASQMLFGSLWAGIGRYPLDIHPILFKDKIIVKTTCGVRAINLETGELVWKYDGRKRKSFLGFEVQSCALYKEKIYASCNNDLICLDANTGKIVWQYDLTLHSKATVGIPVIIDGEVYVPVNSPQQQRSGTLATEFHCYDAENGNILFKQVMSYSSFMKRHNDYFMGPGRIAVNDKVLYMNNGYGVILAYDIRSKQNLWLKKYVSENQTGDVASIYIGVMRFKNPIPDGFYQWIDNKPIIKDNKIMLTPIDSNKLLSIDMKSGKTDWFFEKNQATIILTLSSVMGNYIFRAENLANTILKQRNLIGSTNLSAPQ